MSISSRVTQNPSSQRHQVRRVESPSMSASDTTPQTQYLHPIRSYNNEVAPGQSSWALPPLQDPPPLMFPMAPSFVQSQTQDMHPASRGPSRYEPHMNSKVNSPVLRANRVVHKWLSGEYQMQITERLEQQTWSTPNSSDQKYPRSMRTARVSTDRWSFRNTSEAKTLRPSPTHYANHRVHMSSPLNDPNMIAELKHARGAMRWSLAHRASLNEQNIARQQELDALTLAKIKEKHERKLQMAREEEQRKRLELQHRMNVHRLTERLKQAARSRAAGSYSHETSNCGLIDPRKVDERIFSISKSSHDVPGREFL